MSADAVMSALKTILPTGTTVADVLIRKGVSALVGAFPALILNCPQTDGQFVTIRGYQETHVIHGLYLDNPNSSTRSLEAMLTTARSNLETMRANVHANKTLNVAGTDNCVLAGQKIQMLEDGPVTHEELGFPLVQAEITIEVLDFIIAV